MTGAAEFVAAATLRAPGRPLGELTPQGCKGSAANGTCFANQTIATLSVPESFAPTATGRSWLINPAELSGAGFSSVEIVEETQH